MFNKKTIIIVSASILLVIGLLLFFYFNQRGTLDVQIDSMSISKNVSFVLSNEKNKIEHKAPTSLSLRRGKYMITAWGDEGQLYKKTISISGNKTTALSIVISSSESGGQITPETDSTTPTPEADIKTSVIAQLPHTTTNYSIDYIHATNTFVIDIYTTPIDKYKTEAISYLKTLGLNTDNENISVSLPAYLSGQGY